MKLGAIEYTILEQPRSPEPEPGKPERENPVLGKPILDNPVLEKPEQENPAQLNIDISSKEKSKTDLLSTHSFPIPSPFPEEQPAQPAERKRRETVSKANMDIYREIIMENIEYDYLLQDRAVDREMLDEIVDLIVETVCTSRKTIRVAGDEYPAEVVKSKLLKLDSEHIRFVFDCMRENTTKVRNIKKYLMAVLFNAPSTISSYYTALISHDLYGGK